MMRPTCVRGEERPLIALPCGLVSQINCAKREVGLLAFSNPMIGQRQRRVMKISMHPNIT